MREGLNVVVPVLFSPYGLAEWRGRRRLDFWQHSGDRSRAEQLWLAHDDGPTTVVMGTFESAEPVAIEAAVKLVNLGLPGGQVPRPNGFTKYLWAEIARAQLDWPHSASTPIQVDDEQTVLRYRRFAGWWVGIVEGRHVVVYGTGGSPAALALVALTDTMPYGFDLTRGVRVDDMVAADRPVADRWHPDYRLP